MWVSRSQLTSLGGTQTILAIGKPAEIGISNLYLTIEFSSDNSIAFAFTGNNLLSSTVSLTFQSLNSWIHLAFTYDRRDFPIAIPAQERCIYVNGVRALCDSSTSPFIGVESLILGASAGAGGVGYANRFYGSIDQLRIYGAHPTHAGPIVATDVLCLATNGPIASLWPLRLSWNFAEQTGVVIADSSGSGRTGTFAIDTDTVTWERLPALPVCLQAIGSLCSMTTSLSWNLTLIAGTQTHAGFQTAPSKSVGAPGVVTFDGTQYLYGNVALDTNNNVFPNWQITSTSPATVSAWVRIENFNTARTIAVFTSTATVYYAMYVSIVGQVYWRWNSAYGCGDGGVAMASGVYLQPGVWAQVGAVQNAADSTIFGSGVSTVFASQSYQSYCSGWSTAYYPTASMTLSIGAAWADSSTAAFVGQIASFTVWKAALTTAQQDALSVSPPLSIVPMVRRLVNMPAFQLPGSISDTIAIAPEITTGLTQSYTISVVSGTTSNSEPLTNPMTAITTSNNQFTVTYSVLSQQTPFVTSMRSTAQSAIYFVNDTTVYSTAAMSYALTLGSASLSVNFTLGQNPRNYQVDNQTTASNRASPAVLDGFTFIDLLDPRDVANRDSSIMPAQFGGMYNGFSMDWWIKIRVLPLAGDAASFFDCSTGAGVAKHRVNFQLVGGLGTTTAGLAIRFGDFIGTTTFPAQYFGVALAVQQWLHLALRLDGFGQWTVWLNGQQAGSTLIYTPTGVATTALYANVPQRVTREYCAIGRNFDGTGKWNGLVAAFRFYQRTLTSDEIVALSGEPPASARNNRLYLTGAPFAMIPGASINAEVTSDFLTSAGLTVSISIAPIGYSSPQSVVIGGSATKVAIALTFPSIPANASTNVWTITLKAEGKFAGLFDDTPPILVNQVTIPILHASASFILDTSFQSLHAQWSSPPYAVAWFDGSAGTTAPWLSLTTGLDTGAMVMPTTWGLDPTSITPSGFGFSGWYYVWSKGTTMTSLLQCTSNDGSTSDMFHLYATGTTAGFAYSWSQGSTVVSVGTGPFGTMPIRQWFHLGASMSVFGEFIMTLNGVKLGVTTPQQYAPLYTARSYCSVNRDLTTAYVNTRWDGAVTGITFYSRTVTFAELQFLSQNAPRQTNGNFTFVGFPKIGQDAYVWSGTSAIQITPSLIGGTVTLTMSVSPVGYTSPLSLTWDPSNIAMQSFSLTLTPLPANAKNWTVSFSIDGNGASSYYVPDAMVIMPANRSTIDATRVFRIDPSKESLHAGWTAGVAADTGVVTLNGVNNYLDLTLVRRHK